VEAPGELPSLPPLEVPSNFLAVVAPVWTMNVGVLRHGCGLPGVYFEWLH